MKVKEKLLLRSRELFERLIN